MYEEQYNPERIAAGQWPASKTSYTLAAFPSGEPQKFVNVLPAQVGTTAGAKVIFVDEATGQTEAFIIAYEIDGTCRIIPAADITSYRCALMGALAVSYVRPGALRKYGQDTISLGIVGYGKIGKECERIFRRLFNVEQVHIFGSPRQGVDTASLDLTRCDVVVTATTTRPEDSVLQWRDSYRLQTWVHYDGGFCTHRDFRARLPLFSDDHIQLRHAWETEFPGEPVAADGPHPMLWAKDKRTGAAFALYGVGLADFVGAGL